MENILKKLTKELICLDEKTNIIQSKLETIERKLPTTHIKSVELSEDFKYLIVVYNNGNINKFKIPETYHEKVEYVADENLIQKMLS